MKLLEIRHLTKRYGKEGQPNSTLALREMNFSVEEGEFVAIMGESGSGKSTLLNVIATLDRPTSGEILLQGRNLMEVSEEDLAAFRRKNLGFVFQDFNLLEQFNNKDNILLPLVLSGEQVEEMEKRLQIVSEQLHIQAFLSKCPYEISGGQRQRIAIARAVIASPPLLLADEPTGALDSQTAQEMMEVFRTLNQSGQTILMVTHSHQAASYANRILTIKDGRIDCEHYNDERAMPTSAMTQPHLQSSVRKGEGVQ